jgi:predicted phosphoadenosine phosphosulfate sulfurtransferase
MLKTEVDTTEAGDFWAGVQSSRMRVMQPFQKQRDVEGLEIKAR